ncbi:hypothetical protein M9Y10_018315 [Tritrichomonas musculus]|uniref:Helicase/UvrB N-terminal domain-containing protein n=1 Tax=Tritrichomonas musculus TaxID=1915356 RepID=A0ABR2GM59_9EUKA
MLQESSAVLDVEEIHPKLTDSHDQLSTIEKKISFIQSQINEFINNTEDNSSQSLIEQIKDIFLIFINNKDYLNNDKIFKADLSKFYKKLIIILDIYNSSLSKVSPEYKGSLITKLSKDIDYFQRSLSVFLSNIKDITNRISEITNSTKSEQNEQELKLLDLRLGLECYLFNFCVFVDKNDEFPFFRSNFVTIYHYYNEINNITDKISLNDSYFGTGKTTCISLILFCKNLKEGNKSPFILMVMKDPYHVKSLMNTLTESKLSISEYINVTNDIEELEKTYKNYKISQKGQKLTFGLLTTYNFLPLMHRLENSENFMLHTRFIIDQINQKTCHISVIISQILELYKRSLSNPQDPTSSSLISLNFVLLSCNFPTEVIDFFGNSAKVKTLVKEPLCEIKEEVIEFCESENKEQPTKNKQKKPNFLKQTNKRIKRAIKKTLFRMADSENKDVEEGHVLVFLPDTEQCRKLQYEIIKADFNDRNDVKREKKKRKETK